MQVRPTGTVTFLFTDIEGSTKLWEQNADAMRPALARMQGDDAGAQALYAESLSIRRQLGILDGIAIALDNLGDVALDQGDFLGAQALYAESLGISRHLGDLDGTAEGLKEMAGVALGQGEPERAARLGGAGDALSASIGSPLYPIEQEKFDETLAGAAAKLGEAAFAAAWNAGRAMPWEQAVDYALKGTTE